MHLEEIAFHVAPGGARPGLARSGWMARIGSTCRAAQHYADAAAAKVPRAHPFENVWQFMRDNWLSNRIFKSYDDIVDHCCFAWNKLVDQPWRIMSIGRRLWAGLITVLCRSPISLCHLGFEGERADAAQT